jgi:hypothetical protein
MTSVLLVGGVLRPQIGVIDAGKMYCRTGFFKMKEH